MNNSISTIIPAYNCGETLERAINSILEQTYPVLEIIIINNLSTDKTQAIIDSFIEFYPFLIKTITEKIPGANAARNAGIKLAKGDWIQLLDADDVLYPDKLNHQINLLKTQPSADLICSAAIKIIKKGPDEKEYKTLYITDDNILGLINSEAGITSSNLWKRETLLSLGLFDPKITSSQEYYMMLEFYKNECNVILDDVINTKIYVSEESISNTNIGLRSIKILKNRILYYITLTEVLNQKKQLNNYYKKEITTKINRNYCYNVIHYGDIYRPELKEIKSKYSIAPSVKDKAITYVHQVYSIYGIKSGVMKYPSMIFNLIYRIRLFLKQLS